MAIDATSAGTGVCSEAEPTVDIVNPTGAGDVVLVCEHASPFIPPEYDNLGLEPELLESHIAWDPGALAVAERLSAALDAPLVAQRVSRLVYDCNRPPEAAGAMPEVSEIHAVPGNVDLSAKERAARARRYYEPFHAAVARVLEARIGAGASPVVVTVHSFTPVFKGEKRAVEIGILHDSDARLADALLGYAAGGAWDVRRNEPYKAHDGVTHTLVKQAVSRGLLNVMIEIRNDLIADAAGQAHLAGWLAGQLTAALDDLAGCNAETDDTEA